VVRGSSPQIPVVEIYSAQAEQLQILLFERFVTIMIDLIGDVAITPGYSPSRLRRDFRPPSVAPKMANLQTRAKPASTLVVRQVTEIGEKCRNSERQFSEGF
jgi:hypothetical protein